MVQCPKVRLGVTLLVSATVVEGLTVAVFGGSGFVGRRVCRTLCGLGCDVVSISRSGRPPPYYCDPTYSDAVQWISHDLDDTSDDVDLPAIDAAISCLGNVQPATEWKELFGLGFDDDRLRHENGELNERICDISKRAGAERFVFVSVSYEVAKALEGPIEGYITGKRRAEAAACSLMGADQTVVVGPSLIYGGKRFPNLGRVYRSLVDSSFAKAYVAGNDFLRNLSSTPKEDWVEKMIFSPPVQVDTISRVISAGALGMITREIVGARRQGFFDTDGQPVVYDDVLFVDGTRNIERLDQLLEFPQASSKQALVSPNVSISPSFPEKEPPFEGALIGKSPYLFPFPVIGTLMILFWSVSTQQFVQVASS